MKENKTNLQIKSDQRLRNGGTELKGMVDGNRNENKDKQQTQEWKQMKTSNHQDQVKRQSNEFARYEVASEISTDQDNNEGMYCLVRQFDIEQPVNPASLTFCDLASC